MGKSENLKSKILPTKKKKKESNNSLGLFDHVNQIKYTQTPDYYDTITESDKRSFDHYMILQALSMNPKLLKTVSIAYRYFDVIPSHLFYKLLISWIKPDDQFFKWIKSSKRYNTKLLNLISKRFEISNKESEEYIDILLLSDDGKKCLKYICQEFGKSDKEIEELLTNNNE